MRVIISTSRLFGIKYHMMSSDGQLHDFNIICQLFWNAGSKIRVLRQFHTTRNLQLASDQFEPICADRGFNQFQFDNNTQMNQTLIEQHYWLVNHKLAQRDILIFSLMTSGYVGKCISFSHIFNQVSSDELERMVTRYYHNLLAILTGMIKFMAKLQFYPTRVLQLATDQLRSSCFD